MFMAIFDQSISFLRADVNIFENDYNFSCRGVNEIHAGDRVCLFCGIMLVDGALIEPDGFFGMKTLIQQSVPYCWDNRVLCLSRDVESGAKKGANVSPP